MLFLFLTTACGALPAADPIQLSTEVFNQAETALAMTAAAASTPEPLIATPEPVTPNLIEETPAPTATNMPSTPSDAAFTLAPEWRGIKTRIESYGQLDPDQISQTYIERLQRQVSKYGKAKYITALEYHGDSYTMYDNAYSMDPATFYTQVGMLMQQEYHFVTLPELEAVHRGKTGALIAASVRLGALAVLEPVMR